MYFRNFTTTILIFINLLFKIPLYKSTAFSFKIREYTFPLDMKIKGFDGIIQDSFAETPVCMEYDLLLGTKFLKLCNLNFYGKEAKLDLEFFLIKKVAQIK